MHQSLNQQSLRVSPFISFICIWTLSLSLHLFRIGARRTPIQVKSKHQKVMLVHRNWKCSFSSPDLPQLTRLTLVNKCTTYLLARYGKKEETNRANKRTPTINLFAALGIYQCRYNVDLDLPVGIQAFEVHLIYLILSDTQINQDSTVS